MAQVFPSLEQIYQLRPKPTEGELHLLKFLSENLDNNYEIYFQPFLNGDRPDIILMRPDAGVMIFEVKEWNLGNYDINEKKDWLVTQDRKKWSKIKSPIDQVLSYKQNLYDLHIENSNPGAVVTCAIYFHCENYHDVYNFLTGKFQDDENERYRKFLSHLVILGKDSLNKNSLNQFLRKHYLHRQSRFFNDTLYESFKRHLQSPYHSREEGQSTNFMAQVFPSLEQIHQLRSKPTEGELHLLKFLSENLDNNYEIYFQPFLNGDRPDIILMRPDAGVMIFEVKDWNLVNYDINEKKHWFVTQDGKKWSRIKSPIDQVLSYKQNLYDLHIENLLETRIKNPKTWAVVSCAIYFHCENYDKVDNFLTGKFQDNQNEGYRRFLSHLVILGKDSLNRNSLNQFLRKHYLHRQSKFFNDTLYKSFKRHLQPPYHSREEGKPIEYTSKQEELINSPLKQRKIKGVAGSGKTCILAKRAVNALKRISSSVSSSSENHPDILILTYNITLKNYIHDKISQVREDFPRSCFYIKNYHDFINQELNNLGIEIEIPQDFDNWNSEEKSQYFEDEYYSNISLFRNQKQHLYTYKAIFIDEIQDYEEEWVKIIRECFLENGGEFVVFGDEKQNVYQRSMDQYKKPYTGIRGAWKKLEDTLRLSTHLSSLATAFQANFFEQKYEVETINTENSLKLNFNSQEQIIEYIPITNSSPEDIYNMCNERAIKYMIHPNDICIQSARIEILRNINLYAMQSQQIKTTTTFESLETYYLILLQIIENFNIQNEDLEGQNNIINEIRQYKLRIRELKNMFINNTNNDNINQVIVKVLCYSFHINHPVVEQKLTEYLRTKNITRTEYDRWVSQIMPILKQVSRNNAIMNILKRELEKIRKNKKWNFWMNSGNIKFSTIHSFKGWEVDSLFLIIEREFDDNNFTTDELIYTAITRCRRNLFILDLDQLRYLEFFKSFNHSVIR